MSYCRWSSDCFQSNLYVYEAHEGWIIHVAESRYCSPKPIPKRPDADATADGWIEYHKRCNAWVGSATLEKIGLPCDGETYTLHSPKEAAEKVRELWNLGYNVPDGVIEALMDEYNRTRKGARWKAQ